MVTPVPHPLLSRQQTGAFPSSNAPKKTFRVILYIQVGALGNNARRVQSGIRVHRRAISQETEPGVPMVKTTVVVKVASLLAAGACAAGMAQTAAAQDTKIAL